jgi:integrase/recombinase XerD
VQEKVLGNNPAKIVDLPKIGRKLPEVLKVEKVVRLLNAPDASTPTGLRDGAMLELLYAAGLRVSELVRVTTTNVNLEACFVRVLGKGSKERVVPIGQAAQKRLDLYVTRGERLVSLKTSRHTHSGIPLPVTSWNAVQT